MLKENIIWIVIVLVIILLAIVVGATNQINSFNDTSTEKNQTFDNNDEYVYYINIYKSANISHFNYDIDGREVFNLTLLNNTGLTESIDGLTWNGSYWTGVDIRNRKIIWYNDSLEEIRNCTLNGADQHLPTVHNIYNGDIAYNGTHYLINSFLKFTDPVCSGLGSRAWVMITDENCNVIHNITSECSKYGYGRGSDWNGSYYYITGGTNNIEKINLSLAISGGYLENGTEEIYTLNHGGLSTGGVSDMTIKSLEEIYLTLHANQFYIINFNTSNNLSKEVRTNITLEASGKYFAIGYNNSFLVSNKSSLTVEPYSSRTYLIDFLEFPINVSIDYDGDGSYDNNITKLNYLQTIESNLTIIKSILSNCTADANNTCDVPINITSLMGFISINNINISWTENVTPNVTINEPIGEKKTSTVDYDVDATDDYQLDTCIYWVMRGASLEVANTTITCNDTMIGSFPVSGDASFVFFFWANDSSGNINQSNISFNVDTGQIGGGGGGGGPGQTETIIKGNWTILQPNFNIILWGNTATQSQLTIDNKQGDPIKEAYLSCIPNNGEFDVCPYVSLLEDTLTEAGKEYKIKLNISPGQKGNINFTVNNTIDFLQKYNLPNISISSLFSIVVDIDDANKSASVVFSYLTLGPIVDYGLEWIQSSSLGIPNSIWFAAIIIIIIAAVFYSINKYMLNKRKRRIRRFLRV